MSEYLYEVCYVIVFVTASATVTIEASRFGSEFAARSSVSAEGPFAAAVAGTDSAIASSG